MAIKIQITDRTRVTITIDCKDSVEAERVTAQVASDVNAGKFLSFLDHDDPSSLKNKADEYPFVPGKAGAKAKAKAYPDEG